MEGKFKSKFFNDLDLSDDFFTSLKLDYPGTENSTGFISWFEKKSKENAKAFVYEDESGIGAFLYLKHESEMIKLQDGLLLNAKDRIKIGTLKISNLNRGQRIGEGALGIALWEWQKSNISEIYVTVFPKHAQLVSLLERFGFKKKGVNLDGEYVLVKNRNEIEFDDPYKSFPYLSSEIKKVGYILFEDYYHDSIFAYSELQGIKQDGPSLVASNGLSKVYVSAASDVKYSVGEPVFVYRKYNGEGIKRYKSCVTSLCVVSKIYRVKSRGVCLLSLDDVFNKIGNKSVFDEKDIEEQYKSKNNLIVYELLYYVFFGARHNVNMAWLDEHNMWAKGRMYPTDKKLTLQECKVILEQGGVNVENLIID